MNVNIGRIQIVSKVKYNFYEFKHPRVPDWWRPTARETRTFETDMTRIGTERKGLYGRQINLDIVGPAQIPPRGEMQQVLICIISTDVSDLSET